MPSCTSDPIPAFYQLVFLWLEPASILAGALAACFMQAVYLDLTHHHSAPTAPLPVSVSIVMTQLANLYLGLAMLEATVLRATTDRAVWNRLLLCLLVADFGHLYSVRAVGKYWQYWLWNAIDMGNIPFVYFLAVTRISFFLGLGRQPSRRIKTA